MYGYVCDALSKGHSMHARARRNHCILHPIPMATSTRLFSFSSRSFVTLALFLRGQTHNFSFSCIHTYIHSYLRCVQADSEQNKKISFFFLSLSLSLTHTHTHTHTHTRTGDEEKIAAGRKWRARLSILRNDDVRAHVYAQANVLFLLLT